MAHNPVQLGQLDDQLKVCAAQAIPTDGAADVSASSINLLLTTPRIGQGRRVEMIVYVSTAFGKSAGSPSLNIKPIVDSVSGLGSASPVGQGITLLDGDGTAGAVYTYALPWGPPRTMTKFLGASLTPSTTQFTAGAVSVWFRPV